jgi:hypothetical protein
VTEDVPSGRLVVTVRRRTRDWLGRNWHFLVLACWTFAWFLVMAPRGGIAWNFFGQGTAALFGGPGRFHPPGGLHLYASNPYLQIGPLAFAVAQVLRQIGPHNGVAAAEVALTAAGFAAVVAIEGLARAVRPDLRSRPLALRLTVLAGGAAFLNAWVDLAVGYTHLDDGLALLLAVAAVRAAVARRPVLTGLCVGLATDAKPWALVFLALLLLLPARDWWRGTIAAAVAMAAAWPAVILLGAGARIALDPGVHGYYTAGIMVGALIWDTTGSRRPWPLWSLLSIFTLSVLPNITQHPWMLGDARVAPGPGLHRRAAARAGPVDVAGRLTPGGRTRRRAAPGRRSGEPGPPPHVAHRPLPGHPGAADVTVHVNIDLRLRRGGLGSPPSSAC